MEVQLGSVSTTYRLHKANMTQLREKEVLCYIITDLGVSIQLIRINNVFKLNI
jgi:hypothetical protein